MFGKEQGAFIIQLCDVQTSQRTRQIIPDDVDIKTMVEEVLEETGFKEQRAAKMSVDDLLKYSSISMTCFLSI